MEFRLLGDVEIWAAGRAQPVGTRLQQGVLAVLLADVGHRVTIDTLLDRVWGAKAPAADVLYSYISRIRRSLRQASALDGDQTVSLRSGPAGYVLDCDPNVVDLQHFRHLVIQSRYGLGEGPRPNVLLADALALWRGTPLAGLQGAWAEQNRIIWREEWMNAMMQWAEASLDQGDETAVIATLPQVLVEFPLVERLELLLMRALYASGRSAEALQRYAAVRERLGDELGSAPDRELTSVNEAILRGEELEPPSRQGRHRVVPMQLPADVPAFAGRSAHLAALDHLLSPAQGNRSQNTGRETGQLTLASVSGPAGIGKTALAVHWAHAVADQFPDGQLYVNLRGFDPAGGPMSTAEAVRGFLDALGTSPEKIPATLQAQTALYRSLVTRKRMLVVIDNARDADQARLLLPGSSTCVALVTSRDQLIGLVASYGAQPIVLDLLTQVEARDLLAQRIGDRRVSAEYESMQAIVTACARLPLALSIVAARILQTGFSLASFAADLQHSTERFNVLDSGDPSGDVRNVFSWSYRELTNGAAELFRLLGLYPGPDISRAGAASLAGISLANGRKLLTELSRANLLIEHAVGRYSFHDLLRAYATDLSLSQDSDKVREVAKRRLLDHYTHAAHQADRLIAPQRDLARIALVPARQDTSPETFNDYQSAVGWLTVEYPVLLACIRLAGSAEFDNHVWQLAFCLNTFLDRQGQWQDLADAWKTALHAARRLNDRGAEGDAHRFLADAYIRLGRYVDAETHLYQALDMYSTAEDYIGQANSHHDLTYLRERQGNADDALNHAQWALTLFKVTSHRRGQAAAMNTVGWQYAQRGNYRQALTYCQKSLVLHQKLSDKSGETATWDSIGYAHHHLGHHAEAADSYRRALALSRELGNRYDEAEVLDHLGDSQLAAGDRADANLTWLQALHILTDLDHPDAKAIGLKLNSPSGFEPHQG